MTVIQFLNNQFKYSSLIISCLTKLNDNLKKKLNMKISRNFHSIFEKSAMTEELDRKKLKKASKSKKSPPQNDTDEGMNDDDEVTLMSKSYFFKIVNPNLPIQTHESSPTSISPTECSLLRTCAMLCECSYMKPKKATWPAEVGPPVLYKVDSEITKIPFFINNSDSLNTIFLTCRGSFCFDDVLTDLMGNAIEVCGGRMHQGVYDTASYVYYNAQSVLLQLYNENNSRQIVFTGHSLGAAVSACLCELVRQSMPGINCRCVCLAPPPTVDLSLWHATRSSIKSFILEGDCVPFLSLENVLNISVEILPPKVAKTVQKWIHGRLKTTARGAYDPNNGIQLCPPGELYLFIINESGNAELRSIGPEYFDCLVRGLQDTNHVMSNYLATIMSYFKNNT
ncbi:hypothetical protein TRFO_32662 [Tritrichomonas foetus]|uniref:sn-1-specific diacylglycerol lipase n=1 Tax=Tritrichomonas foetus TaxID=1144522 RepID=A0A1J4JNH7_9EUKA|nr:hypothetical protein TRFO_32662 [Tritrichomonas foetus]|eukprot:OHT00635.1 hypothetical protein TRFO_32662 [Tritrichomonas foetus]